MKRLAIAKIMVLVISLTMNGIMSPGAESTVRAKGKSAVKKVKVGKQLSLGNRKKGASYKSSDSRIASVSREEDGYGEDHTEGQ